MHDEAYYLCSVKTNNSSPTFMKKNKAHHFGDRFELRDFSHLMVSAIIATPLLFLPAMTIYTEYPYVTSYGLIVSCLVLLVIGLPLTYCHLKGRKSYFVVDSEGIHYDIRSKKKGGVVAWQDINSISIHSRKNTIVIERTDYSDVTIPLEQFMSCNPKQFTAAVIHYSAMSDNPLSKDAVRYKSSWIARLLDAVVDMLDVWI